MKQDTERFEIYSARDVKNYGASKGIILGVIRHWCKINKKKERYFFDGNYWSGHMTQEQIAEQTGLDIQSVKRGLKWLIDNEIIAKGNYNKVKYDRTGWYYPLVQIDTIYVSKQPNAKYQNDTIEKVEMVLTIPVTPYNLSKNPPITPCNSFEELSVEQIDKLTEEQRVEYYTKRNEYQKIKI